MKKLNLSLGLILLLYLSSISLSSCSNDGYSLDKFAVILVTAKNFSEGDNQRFYLKNEESGKTYWIGAPLQLPSIKDGQRLIVNITLLSDKWNGFDHFVRLNRIEQYIETKPVNVLKKGAEDIYGKDPFMLTDSSPFFKGVSLEGMYLNVGYALFEPTKEMHQVYLVYNEQKEYPEDGYIHLELRYNAFGDELKNPIPASVSFDLNSLNTVISDAYKGVAIHRINKDNIEELVGEFDFNTKKLSL